MSYHPQHDSHHTVDSQPLLPDDEFIETKSKPSVSRNLHIKMLWVAIALLTAMIFVIGILSTRPNGYFPRSDTVGISDTEFGPTNASVEMSQVRFTSGIRHAANGTLIRTNPERMGFVGPPSETIDTAWDELTHGLDLYIRDEEASIFDKEKLLGPKTSRNVWQIEIEWLHSLHCLNYLRKSFNFEYYEQDLHHPQASHNTHIDHCINALRQVIQCHGDLTPLPKFRDMETGREYTDFERVHTCRSFEPLRNWANERGYDSLVESLE